MRSLQRLQHQRPLAPREVTHVQRDEGSAIRARARAVRRKRTLRVLAMTVVVALGTLVIHRLLTSRVVVQGLVRTDFATVEAPARVRVAQLFVTTGQTCERGDPLVRLEAIDGQAERRVLELEVQRAESRHQIVAAGGDLGSTDIHRRQELLSNARVEVQLAEAAARRASAEWQALVRQRTRTEVELRRDKLQAEQEVARLTARTESLEAETQGVGAGRVLAELEAEQGEDLHADGLVSERDRVAAEVARRIAQQEWQSAGVILEASKAELLHATGLDLLEDERARSVLQELDARIAAAQRALELELSRRDLWTDVARARGDLLPDEPLDPRQLRDLELRTLELEFETAKARLEAFDQRAGNVVVLAKLDGIVDTVLVRVGSIVEAGEPLIRTLDPRALYVEGYADPGSDTMLLPGAECTLVPEGVARPLEAKVDGIAASWEPCPPALLVDGTPESNPRLPFRVVSETPFESAWLRPGMRVRIVFER